MRGSRTRTRFARIASASAVIVVLVLFANGYALDGVIGYAWSAIGAAPTEFSPGYSNRSFRAIKIGMNEADVRRFLGAPLSRTLRYPPDKYVTFDESTGKMTYAYGLLLNDATLSQVRQTLGKPDTEVWSYSKSPTTSSYSVRAVVLREGTVIEVVHNLRWE